MQLRGTALRAKQISLCRVQAFTQPRPELPVFNHLKQAQAPQVANNGRLLPRVLGREGAIARGPLPLSALAGQRRAVIHKLLHGILMGTAHLRLWDSWFVVV